jgi:flagellar motility protein MotE (MotC chaperone)
MKKKNHTYKYYYLENGDVIALSHFAGKTVKATAYLKDGDTYNREIGEKVAAAKCNEKIAGLRYRRAVRMVNEAVAAYEKAKRELDNMIEYRERSYGEWNTAQDELVELIKSTGWVPQH